MANPPLTSSPMTKKILIVITVLALVIRLVNLNYPPLLWDEASLGYNAYSIIKTGHDEYGKFLPYIFKSFGDYKPGLYVYLAVPFVAIFGLNPISVRLPSAILGSLLPLFFYLLIIKLSPKSKRLALLAAAVLAFNPWNIHYSRGAWETNVLLFELVLGAILYLGDRYFWSSLVFALTLYTYQGGKIMTPLIIIALLLTKIPQIKLTSEIKKFFIPLFIFSLPILIGLVTQNDANRLRVFGLWNYQRPATEVTQISSESNTADYYLFHNQFVFFLQNFATRYFNHFSTRFLSFEGDWQIGRQAAPYIGVLLYPSLGFLIIGLFFTLTKKLTPISVFFLFWLLISPLPAALTRDMIQPVRALEMSLPLIFFVAVGLDAFFSKFTSPIFKLLVFFLYLISFAYYSDLYFTHMVKVKPDDWLYGYQEAAQYVIDHQQNNTVYFSNFYGQPYIYYLFYSQYPPQKYQSQANLQLSGLDTGKVAQIDNIHFEAADFASSRKKSRMLMIYTYDDAISQGIDLKLLTPLSPINGRSTFYAYQTN